MGGGAQSQSEVLCHTSKHPRLQRGPDPTSDDEGGHQVRPRGWKTNQQVDRGVHRHLLLPGEETWAAVQEVITCDHCLANIPQCKRSSLIFQSGCLIPVFAMQTVQDC